MSFHIPDQPELLEALGTVSLRHAQLDYILKMTIKTLAGLTPQEALDATAFEGSAMLRDNARRLAKQKLGDGTALLRLKALLERCRRATEKRNDLVHSVWATAMDGDGGPAVRKRDHTWGPLPTVTEITELATTLVGLINEINEARFDGYIAQALAKRNKAGAKGAEFGAV